jgi:N-acetylglucosaminyldiphosphoundecaprenol N-acetyl-beta-D-mannosaminyltransferase
MEAVADARIARERVAVAGTEVDLLSPQRLLGLVEDAVATRTKARVIFCNVSTVVACRDNRELQSAVQDAEVISPDGMPLVWVAKLKGEKAIERVPGPSFLPAAVEHGIARGWRHYFYGGSPETLEQLTASLSAQFPGVQIAGAHSPPFRALSSEEIDADIARINEAHPDLVWVGLGMPKQELWMARYQSRLRAPVLLGVGAAFDFNAGTMKRAPQWMQRLGLEWSHRLVHEPTRLWRRYVVGNTRFLLMVALEMFRDRRRSPGGLL